MFASEICGHKPQTRVIFADWLQKIESYNIENRRLHEDFRVYF